ncbi:hypothetical protein MATL_G00005300 [Megalops atlanticus]|uniref:A-kinase anchor protein 2 C-terminal domain-containing protein n=1 Tax=Megalops atlanticus TaxID=7932 RepID=A0A9D3TJ92_MEGAT|nr:hypothetical protein MATL_G00005300 [Megalops atlanticus]
MDDMRGGGEDPRVDCKPLDFSTARKQWVRLDSTSSRPPKPSFSRRLSDGQILVSSPTATSQPSQQQQEEGTPQHAKIAQERQQGELLLHRLCLLQQRQEVQQVFDRSPPLATVALEPANEVAECCGSSSVVKELAGRGNEGEGEEGAGGQMSGEGEQSIAGLHTGEEGQEEQRERSAENEQRVNTEVKEGKKAKSGPPAHLKDSRVARMEVENGEDNQSDSGVSADFSPGSTVELHSAPLTSEEHSRPPSPPNETPIEREIRRAMEREQSLRKSRGLSKTEEFVEIPLRKPILSQALPSKSSQCAGKDRQFAGKKMQREINAETEREQVLVQLGKVPGVYDKGTVRQLREKKQLFEAFQEIKETPRTSASQSKRASSSASDISALGVQGDGSTTTSILERTSSMELLGQSQNQNPACSHSPAAPCGPTLSEGTTSQVIILENNLVLRAPLLNPDRPLRTCHSTGSLSEGHRVTVVDSGTMFPSLDPGAEDRSNTGEDEGRQEEEEEESPVPKENPFFKLRSSMSLKPQVEQDIREARERERELRRQRNSLYGVTGAGRGQPPSTEIRSPTPPQNGLLSPEPNSWASSSTPSARQSLRKLDFTWPPPQNSMEATEQTEAPIHPRAPRQKNPLLQRWESGIVNGHHEEQD